MDTFETTIYNAVLITAIVIGTIIFYFGVTMFRNHRKHFNLLSQHFQQEMELLEKERTRIARDLHDELGPLLSVVQIQINSVGEISIQDQEYLNKAGRNIEILTERFEGIARNLTPRSLVSKGLQTALEDFIEQYKTLTPIRIKLFYKAKNNYSGFYTLHIYRIIQELIHNGIKHSAATSIVIHVAERKNKLYLLYEDDGKGINEDKEAMKAEGLGLSSLKNRSEMLGGKMTINGNQKKGNGMLF